MVTRSYIPKRGDLVWVDFLPQQGHEQAGRRPGLVLSSLSFNERIGLMLCCPVTKQEKGYSFEIPIRTRKIKGIILADQARSFDWRTRAVEYADKAPDAVVEKVGLLIAKIAHGE